VDYSEEGIRNTPTPAEEAVLYVDCDHQIRIRSEVHWYRLRYLHIYTRSAFGKMLDSYDIPSALMLERTFGFALRRAAGR